MSFIKPARMAFIAAVLLWAVPLRAETGIEIQGPYAIAAPGGMSGAAFLTIRNVSDTPDRLIDVRSDAAARVELHAHIAGADGVMTMVHVEEGFELPAGGQVLLERGGNHIMFMGLTAPFEDGMTVPVTLVFKAAGEITIEVPVDLARMASDAASG